MDQPLVIYVDIDDTLVRSFGSKRIPMTSVIEGVRRLYDEGAQLYAWSSGGAEYAKTSADELGLGNCFIAFLPKPNVLIDDQAIEEWRQTVHVRPHEASQTGVLDYRRRLFWAPPES